MQSMKQEPCPECGAIVPTFPDPAGDPSCRLLRCPEHGEHVICLCCRDCGPTGDDWDGEDEA